MTSSSPEATPSVAPSCELEGVSIVLLGKFNPSIFQPAWLAAQQLIRADEAESAEIQVIHRELTVFTASWLTLNVGEDRFSASTADASYFQALRDLVIGIFTLLEHTPIEGLGMNRQMHYKMSSEERWHALGHLLAPKEGWRQVLQDPGLLRLAIQGYRGTDPQVQIRVVVEPSVRVKPGVFFDTNEHRATSGPDALRRLMSILSDSWEDAQKYAKSVAEHILLRQRY